MITDCKPGMIVKSVSGHDGGSWYVVLEYKDGYAYIADGRGRKAEKPKKKNLRHLDRSAKTAELTEKPTNRELKKLLREYNS